MIKVQPTPQGIFVTLDIDDARHIADRDAQGRVLEEAIRLGLGRALEELKGLEDTEEAQ